MTANFFWPSIGLFTFTLVVVVFVRGMICRSWSGIGLLVASACAVVAIMNAIAPFRSVLDTHYPGYEFGLVVLGKGWPVSIFTSLLYTASVISSALALANGRGPQMWIVAANCAFISASLGGAILVQTIRDGAVEIQFGQYATIPGPVATPLLITLIVVPLLAGSIWAARRAICR